MEYNHKNSGVNDVKKILVCVNQRLTPATPSCAQRNSVQLATALARHIAEEGLAIEVERVYCLGRCNEGPTLKLVPGGEFLLGLEMTEMMERIRAFAAPAAQQP